MFKSSTSSNVSLSFDILAFLPILFILFSITSKSAIASSAFIVSISLTGSIFPSTCVIFESSKHLTTSTIASTSLICDKNLFPNPSPLDAPFTSPAISVNSNDVGTKLFGSYSLFKKSNLSSGTVTIPTLGSIVAKG